MTDLDTHRAALREADDLHWLRRPPESIADALERTVRIDALSAWLADLREDLTKGYLTTEAADLEARTGASFRAPVKELGLVYRTDPQPKVVIADAETFARWYVTAILDDDPDRDPDPGSLTVRFGDVMRRRTVTVRDQRGLLDMLDMLAGIESSTVATADVLAGLEKVVEVDDEWLIGDAISQSIVDALDLTVTDTWAVIRSDTGERIPGLIVHPPGRKVLTVKADPAAKRRLRQELDRLLGPAALQPPSGDDDHDPA
jgi:hypothetical protein